MWVSIYVCEWLLLIWKGMCSLWVGLLYLCICMISCLFLNGLGVLVCGLLVMMWFLNVLL